MSRILPITDAELHYELTNEQLVPILKEELHRLKEAGYYSGSLKFEIEEIEPYDEYDEGRYRLVIWVMSNYHWTPEDGISPNAEYSSGINVEKIPYNLELIPTLIEREKTLGAYLEEELGEPIIYDFEYWQKEFEQLHPPVENTVSMTEFVYEKDGIWFSATCPNEKASALKQALSQIMETEPSEHKIQKTL